MTKKGQPVAVTRRGGKNRSGSGAYARGAFRFYRLPPPQPPSKEGSSCLSRCTVTGRGVSRPRPGS